MIKKLPFGKIVFCLFLLLIVSYSCRKKAPASHAYEQRVDVAYPVVRPIVLHKEYPGYLTSEQTVKLVSRVNGYLQEIRYKPGQDVRKGDLLFVVEPTLYEDNVKQAESDLKKAAAQLNYAENNYSRMKEAALSNAVSEIDVIQSESNLKQAKSSVLAAQSQLKTAQTNLSYCYIRAPFNGHVSKNQVDVGSFLNGSVNAVVLAQLYKDDKMFAYFNIEDNQYMKIKISNPDSATLMSKTVELLFNEKTKKQYTGKLDYVSPNIELSTGTLNLRAQIDNPDGELKSGMYVKIRLPYGERDKAVLINDGSIGTDQLGKFVYVVNDSNIINYRHIEIGELVSDTLREVTNGIQPTDRYVTKALLKVRTGMKVDPVVQ